MTYGLTYDFTRYDQYVAYFKALAEDHPAFFHGPKHKSFFQWKMEDLDRTLADINLAFPALLIEEPESNFSDNGAGYVTDGLMGAIVVLDHLPNNTAAGETELKANCKRLALSILARMYHDKYQLRITGFNPTDSKGAYVGPVWDNCYGFRLEFLLTENSTDAKLNPDDFTETLVDGILHYAMMNGYTVTDAQSTFDTIYKLRRI